jgi:hypothetical protein
MVSFLYFIGREEISEKQQPVSCSSNNSGTALLGSPSLEN